MDGKRKNAMLEERFVFVEPNPAEFWCVKEKSSIIIQDAASQKSLEEESGGIQEMCRRRSFSLTSEFECYKFCKGTPRLAPERIGEPCIRISEKWASIREMRGEARFPKKARRNDDVGILGVEFFAFKYGCRILQEVMTATALQCCPSVLQDFLSCTGNMSYLPCRIGVLEMERGPLSWGTVVPANCWSTIRIETLGKSLFTCSLVFNPSNSGTGGELYLVLHAVRFPLLDGHFIFYQGKRSHGFAYRGKEIDPKRGNEAEPVYVATLGVTAKLANIISNLLADTAL